MVERDSWHVVGEKIRRLRKESGLTLRQLGLGCGLSSNAISLVERGRVAPTIETLCKIAHALGVSAGSLFREACPTDVILNRAADGLIASLAGEGGQSLFKLARGQQPAQAARSVCGASSPVSQTVLCICGKVAYEVDDQSYELGPGDRLTFIGDSCQHWRNPSAETAIAVMILPPVPPLPAAGADV